MRGQGGCEIWLPFEINHKKFVFFSLLWAVCYADLSGSAFICEGIYNNSANSVKCKIRLSLPAQKFDYRREERAGIQSQSCLLDWDMNLKRVKYLQLQNLSAFSGTPLCLILFFLGRFFLCYTELVHIFCLVCFAVPVTIHNTHTFIFPCFFKWQHSLTSNMKNGNVSVHILQRKTVSYFSILQQGSVKSEGVEQRGVISLFTLSYCVIPPLHHCWLTEWV